MPDLSGKRIAILATDGFEQSELEVPKKRLAKMGAQVDVISLDPGKIRGWDDGDWGSKVAVDRTVDEVSVDDYDALVLPGGVINPDKLRTQSMAIEFVKGFYDSGKLVAAICHGPWMLIEAGLVSGRTVTSWKSLRTDIENAGAQWVDEEVVFDDGLVTSRSPADLDAFVSKIAEVVLQGLPARTMSNAAIDAGLGAGAGASRH